MGLESVTLINDFVITNPTASDPRSEGDDHLRNIKKAVKATFPNVTAAVTVTAAEMNRLAGVGSDITTLLAAKANLSGATFTGDIVVPAEAYAAGWDGNNEAPTKNDVYDKIESILDGQAFTGDITVPDEAYGAGWNGSLEVPTKNAVYDKFESFPSGIGSGQTWQNVLVSGPRASGVTYTNSTGKPIMVTAGSANTGVTTAGISAICGGVTVANYLTRGDSGWPIQHSVSFIVPNGVTYSCTGTLTFWSELR